MLRTLGVHDLKFPKEMLHGVGWMILALSKCLRYRFLLGSLLEFLILLGLCGVRLDLLGGGELRPASEPLSPANGAGLQGGGVVDEGAHVALAFLAPRSRSAVPSPSPSESSSVCLCARAFPLASASSPSSSAG
eukprot:CAMPEP_0114492436 /NCGR_PEP_ID=MMETSP0109-20121206/3552_1 /TAXON_ID=29199 /ORGANISM="Chlorarachnion reptans, Strain CCCM449" /LENGTH=133 /DNA_ID=CAMNT_0001669275 /DNA_START=674 /DNA_END=1072 /DNA_ORIENTATION=+